MCVRLTRRKLGILGAGQLAQMTCLAGQKLGYEMHVFANSEMEPAALVADKVWRGEWTDTDLVIEFAKTVNAFAYDTEHLPISSVNIASNYSQAFPHPELLFATQNRIRERELLQSFHVPMPKVAFIRNNADIMKVVDFGYPAVLKTAEQGYDGKGQIKVEAFDQLTGAWEQLGNVPCVLEEWIHFTKEMSVLVARGIQGDSQVYPVVDNDHVNHILHQSSIPSTLLQSVQEEAERIARHIAESVSLTGLLAVEMFYTAEGKVWVNELAPRPHNSGHLTQLSAKTSQFEQLVLAMAGESLGAVDTRPAVMLNLLGDLFMGEHASRDYLKHGFIYPTDAETNVFFYGKKEARPGRKMGHLIAVADTRQEAKVKAEKLYQEYERANH